MYMLHLRSGIHTWMSIGDMTPMTRTHTYLWETWLQYLCCICGAGYKYSWRRHVTQIHEWVMWRAYVKEHNLHIRIWVMWRTYVQEYVYPVRTYVWICVTCLICMCTRHWSHVPYVFSTFQVLLKKLKKYIPCHKNLEMSQNSELRLCDIWKFHKISQNVTKCHKMSQNVTKCHTFSNLWYKATFTFYVWMRLGTTLIWRLSLGRNDSHLT